MSEPTIHAFNTGRLYTADGQQIAWCVLSSGNVAMRDVCRMIDYVLQIDGTPTDRSVLAAYDANRTAPFNRADLDEAFQLQRALGAAARAVPLSKAKRW